MRFIRQAQTHDFRDPDHMHPDGAKRYSAIIAKEVIAPVLRTLGGDDL